MNSFASVLFSLFLGWLKTAAASLYKTLTSPQSGTFFLFVGENWKTILLVLLVVGTVLDLVVYFLRWHPHEVWASFFRRLSGKDTYKGKRVKHLSTHLVGGAYVGPDHALQRSPEQLVYVDPQEEILPGDEIQDTGMVIVRRKRQKAVKKPSRLREFVRWVLADQEDVDTAPMHYTRTQPAVDEREAYHEAYIPPQWQKPEERILRRKRLQEKDNG